MHHILAEGRIAIGHIPSLFNLRISPNRYSPRNIVKQFGIWGLLLGVDVPLAFNFIERIGRCGMVRIKLEQTHCRREISRHTNRWVLEWYAVE